MATTRPDHRRGMSKGAIRAERRVRSAARKRRKRMILWIGGGLFAAAFIASLLVPGGLRARHNLASSHSNTNTGGLVAIQPDQGRNHIPVGTRFVRKDGAPAYNTLPATSGDHWPVAPPSPDVPSGVPAKWGFYTDELPDEVLVHNLEHGGIGLHYNCPEGCGDLVKQLRGLVPAGASQFIVSPYSNMPSRIAVTAWRHIMYLDSFDENRIREFIRDYQDRAPESVPNDSF